jgi:hypothetical protein
VHERHVLGLVVGAPIERFLRWDIEFLDEFIMHGVGDQVDRRSTLFFPLYNAVVHLHRHFLVL